MPLVQEFNCIDDLAPHRLLWNSLWRQTPQAAFFQSLDWLEAYWRHFGGDQKLRALLVSAAGKPIGILPLVVRTEPTRVGPVRVLTYPLHDWGTFFGPIGPNPTATLLLGLEHVSRTGRDWDLLDLRWVDKTGLDRGRTHWAMRAAGFCPREQALARGAVVEMSGTWEAYWRGRAKKWRDNVGRLQRRLSEQGEASYLRYRPKGQAYGDGHPRWDLYDACVRLAEKSWQGSSTDGNTLSHPGVAAFLRDAHAAAARSGTLDLNLLVVRGRPAAFAYNYCCEGRIVGLRVGFDPELAAFGPGTVLQRMVLEDSFRRGDRLYDLGVGSLECKRPWQTALVTNYRYTHFPPTVARAQLLRLKRWYQDHLCDPEAVVLARSA